MVLGNSNQSLEISLMDPVSVPLNLLENSQAFEPSPLANKISETERNNEADVVVLETMENIRSRESNKIRRKARRCQKTSPNFPPTENSISNSTPSAISFHDKKTSALTRIHKNLSHSVNSRRPRFPRFSELPAEIRLLIWEYTFVPRVHELHPCAKLYNERMTFRSNSSKTPAIFHVCRESRQLALKNYSLMSYEPRLTGASGKGILRFYFSPELDTLFLNSLMGLFIMFMLLEDEDEYAGVGIMKEWQKVAFDADRVQLISLLAGIAGHAPHPRLKAVFPSLKDFTIAFDYSSKGKIRFRTSVWPGENGTSLEEVVLPHLDSNNERLSGREQMWSERLEMVLRPMRHYLDLDFKDEDQGYIPTVKLANVKRKAFLRGDIRYVFRKTCTFLGIRPRGPFKRL